MNTIRPPFESVPLAVGRQWRGGAGFLYEEKLDGVFHAREYRGSFGSCMIVGELVGGKCGSHYAFDIVHYAGQDLRALALRDRLKVLGELQAGELRGEFLRPASGQGGEFLEAVLARGGEGVVAKPLDAPYGALWYKCKRVETRDCVILEKHSGGKSSVRLGEVAPPPGTGIIDRGWMPLRGSKFDQVSCGMVIEVTAYGEHASGLFREARPFLNSAGELKIRYDKMTPLQPKYNETRLH